MRIGVNCYLLQPHIGGLKQYFLTLFHELLEHDAEHEYIFFWYRHNAAELFDPASSAALAAAIERVAGDEAWREMLRARGFRRAREFSAARMAEEHRAVFREAVQVYSPLAFLWRRWVTGYWHQARLEWRWRPHGCSVAQWVKASRHWFEDPAR